MNHTAMRGRIPRRTVDTRRKPVRPERKAERREVAAQRKALFALPVWHDCGEVLIPAHGSVKVFERRFPCAGVLDKASIRVQGLPEHTRIWLRISADDETLMEVPIQGGDVTRIAAAPVDSDRTFTAHLCQIDAPAPQNVRADIAYIFTEAQAGAPADLQPEV